jgi:hypothetical protein
MIARGLKMKFWWIRSDKKNLNIRERLIEANTAVVVESFDLRRS